MSITSKDPRSSADQTAGADPRRWLGLAVLAAMQFMLVLDITVVTVALPGSSTICTSRTRVSRGWSAVTC